MDLLLSFVIFIATMLCFLIFDHLRTRIGITTNNNRALGERVPEPAGAWPIIGHLHLLAGSQLPHKVLGSMADKFGSIFTIKLGVHRVLVVSNSEMAKECLTTNDRVFASRPKSLVTDLMSYNYANLGLAPYGPYWRLMRKIIVIELFSHHCLRMLAHIRVSEVTSSVKDIYTTWARNKGQRGVEQGREIEHGPCILKTGPDKGSSETVMVDVKEWFGNLIVNIVVRMMFGNHFSPGEQNGDQFRKAIRRFVELLATFVPSDGVPWLRWLDLGGYEKMMKKTAKEMDVVINGWLEEHKRKMNSSSTMEVDDGRVFMAAVLSRVEEEVKEEVYGFNTDAVVKATCLAIYAAASDTTAVTLTWALSLLVNHPVALKRAQLELEHHVGKDRKVEESDMNNLVYLQAVIKETMRLYPAAPLSVPHESIEDCIVGGYTVPKGTRLFVNVWKIHHDPQIWTDPFEFRPERFLTSKQEIDVKGRHFELIPFGSGRRMCPGISFALETMKFILASILHGFEFRSPSNEQIDMTEGPGIVIQKASPLELLVAPRLLPHVYDLA